MCTTKDLRVFIIMASLTIQINGTVSVQDNVPMALLSSKKDTEIKVVSSSLSSGQQKKTAASIQPLNGISDVKKNGSVAQQVKGASKGTIFVQNNVPTALLNAKKNIEVKEAKSSLHSGQQKKQ